MQSQIFIGCDWGTSSLRLYLCDFRQDQGAEVIDQRSGPGVLECAGEQESTFFNLTQDWFREYGQIPSFLSGMVGSNIGWQPVPYVKTPTEFDQILSQLYWFEARGQRLAIVPGLMGQSPTGLQDIMRGEELQLIGWYLTQRQAPPDQTQLVALPGTHNKWVKLEENSISHFLTIPTGELFQVLKQHSVLIPPHADLRQDNAAFLYGLKTAHQSPGLLSLLFSTRVKQVLEEYNEHQAASYLSGLIVGTDCYEAIQAFHWQSSQPVTLIGRSDLCENYSKALAVAGIDTRVPDAQQLAVLAYSDIFKRYFWRPED